MRIVDARPNRRQGQVSATNLQSAVILAPLAGDVGGASALLVASVARMERASSGRATPRVPLGIDSDSREWLAALRAEGPVAEDAVRRLHALLLRAARFEVARRRPMLPHLRGDALDEIALEAANDALVSVLSRLEEFRGASRFTTWAYKFALLEAAVRLRRRAWQGREIPLEPEGWTMISGHELTPEEEAEQGELLGAVKEAIETALTPHQKRVLVAVVLNGVPLDVLAERLGTTRGALYKTLHDARRTLRRRLHDAGFQIERSCRDRM